MREGNIFSLFTLAGGRGVPCPRSEGGGYPIQVCMVGGTPSQVWGGGVPWPGLDGGEGYPIPGLVWGGYSSQVWIVGDTPDQVWGGGYPIPGVGGIPARSGWWGVPPWPGLDGGGYLGSPLLGLDGGRVPPPAPPPTSRAA